MATLKVEVVSALGTNSKTLTFSGADAARIISAFQSRVPGGTQQQLTDFLAAMLKDYCAGIVVRKETVNPTPPDMT